MIYTVCMNSNAPLFNSPVVSCGFPSPADDHMQLGLNLNHHLIKHPAATFFVRAYGQPMCDTGILDGDLLVVDKSLTPTNNSIIIAVINGEFTVRRLKIINGESFLYSANANYKPIAIANIPDFQAWGVVIYAIHDLRAS